MIGIVEVKFSEILVSLNTLRVNEWQRIAVLNRDVIQVVIINTMLLHTEPNTGRGQGRRDDPHSNAPWMTSSVHGTLALMYYQSLKTLNDEMEALCCSIARHSKSCASLNNTFASHKKTSLPLWMN